MNTHNVNHYDVLVVGGGPAGSASALTLLNQSSLDVCVIETTNYDNMRIGESVSPSIMPLMKYLGIEKEFIASNHLPAHGIDAAWGSPKILSRDFFFTGYGNGWNLDRRVFDQMMADAVKKRNGSLLHSTTLEGITKEKNWIFVVSKDGEKIEMQADFVIEASGKNASFARSIGARWNILDHLVGIGTVYETAVDELSNTLVESVSDGWWYSTPLPNNKRIVVFMTDSDISKNLKIKKTKNWIASLNKTLHIKKTVTDAKMITTPKIFPAYSQIIKETNFSEWIPAGDAVASFDPLSSVGVGHAIVSGIEAARVAYNNIKSDGRLLPRYLKNVFENYDQYKKNRKRFYRYEKRWANKPFWKRRS